MQFRLNLPPLEEGRLLYPLPLVCETEKIGRTFMVLPLIYGQLNAFWREAPKNNLGAKRHNKTRRCVQAPVILRVSARRSRVFALPN